MKTRRPQRNPRGTRGGRPRGETGSILLILLIFLAVVIIMMAAAAPKLAQQIKRDRETEMIHRGEQYARAIKRYYKKFGRYPAKLEDLENTNNLRFLRKRYKDPMSPEGNWKLVHFGEVQLGQGGAGSAQPGTQQPQSLLGGQQEPQQTSDQRTDPRGAGFGQQPGGVGQQGGTAGQGGATGNSASGIFGTPLSGQQFGGGPILGVASLSEKTGVHEFNNKRRYNQWLFVYDPTQDRGGLIKGPYNPKANVGSVSGGPGQPGQPVMPNIPGNPFGGQAQQPPQTQQTTPVQ